jgi:hypothetical protein
VFTSGDCLEDEGFLKVTPAKGAQHRTLADQERVHDAQKRDGR